MKLRKTIKPKTPNDDDANKSQPIISNTPITSLNTNQSSSTAVTPVSTTTNTSTTNSNSSGLPNKLNRFSMFEHSNTAANSSTTPSQSFSKINLPFGKKLADPKI